MGGDESTTRRRIYAILTELAIVVNLALVAFASVLIQLSPLSTHPPAFQRRLLKVRPMLRVISYNIRNANAPDGLHGWPYRCQRVLSLLSLYQPDLIGLQEVLPSQRAELMAGLPDYGWLGVGRDHGDERGEHTLIGYRQQRLRPLQSSVFWLSPTPEVAGSIGWDAAYPRTVTWARFVDQSNQQPFLHLNTHFDHRGAAARLESARRLRTFLATAPTTLPVIVTGDFNCTVDEPPYQALTVEPLIDGPVLVDAMQICATPHHGPTATTNSNFANPLRVKIDYIFCRPTPQLQVLRHAILADHWDGFYPSDHLPVLADLAMTGSETNM